MQLTNNIKVIEIFTKMFPALWSVFKKKSTWHDLILCQKWLEFKSYKMKIGQVISIGSK